MSRTLRSPFAIFAAILLAVLAVQTFKVASSEWQLVYVQSGEHLLKGLDFYSSGTAYAYPPFMAWVAVPFAALPEWASRLAWFVASAAGMITMMVAGWRLAGGGDLLAVPLSARREWIIFWVGMGCGLTYILNSFAHQQTDVIMGGLVIGGAALLIRGKALSAAFLLGIGAAIKATPMLWAPYLLLRGRWFAAIVLAVVALLLNLPIDLIAPAPTYATWLQEWLYRFVLQTQSLGADAGVWGTALEYNQSLVGTMQRLINTDFDLAAVGTVSVSNPVLGAGVVKAIVYLLFLLLLAVSILAGRRARARGDKGPVPVEMLDYNLILILMLLLSPMSGRAHFGLLLLPGFCLARIAFATGSRALWTLLGLAVLLTLVANKDLVGRTLYDAFLWGGATTACTLLLWLGCVLVLWRPVGVQSFASGDSVVGLTQR
jgi:hypothetical protein